MNLLTFDSSERHKSPDPTHSSALWVTEHMCVSQGMLSLVSNCIDRLSVYNSAAHFGECAGDEAGAAWKDILNLLYELLGNFL